MLAIACMIHGHAVTVWKLYGRARVCMQGTWTCYRLHGGCMAILPVTWNVHDHLRASCRSNANVTSYMVIQGQSTHT